MFKLRYAAEERFLLDTLVLGVPERSGGYDLKGLNWEKIIILADFHRFAFYILKAVKAFKIKINKQTQIKLEQLEEREKHRYFYFQYKLPQVLEALNKIKIKYALLKGGFLAFDLYPAGARFLSDLDILVAEKDKEKTVRALLKTGFKEDKTKSDRDTTVLKDPHGLEIELTTGLGVLKNILPAGELLAHTEKIKLLNMTALVLNREYNLLHICLHTSMTHSFYDIAKLIDINELLKSRAPDPKKLEALAKKKGVYRAVFLPVEVCGILWKSNSSLKHNISAGAAGRLIKFNLETALRIEYNKRASFYSYLIPVLIADSLNLKFSMVFNYLKKKVQNG